MSGGSRAYTRLLQVRSDEMKFGAPSDFCNLRFLLTLPFNGQANPVWSRVPQRARPPWTDWRGREGSCSGEDNRSVGRPRGQCQLGYKGAMPSSFAIRITASIVVSLAQIMTSWFSREKFPSPGRSTPLDKSAKWCLQCGMRKGPDWGRPAFRGD